MHDRSWVWRWARGYTKRANSINALDPNDDADIDKRLDRLTALSTRHGIAPVFRVTPLASPAVSAVLDARGWVRIETSHVLAMNLVNPEMTGATGAVSEKVTLHPPADPAWLEAQAALAGYDNQTRDSLGAVLTQIPCAASGLLVWRDGAPVAAALATVSGGIAIFVNVVVAGPLRGQGLGRQVMVAALDWAKEQGADHAAIQVVAGNEPAIGLYTALGFEPRYDYHYRLPGEGVSA
uniref:GNAT family N-acetyltransferase n=1 Tax=Cucumibacter marinus TaxID=1121252 RepID=UPI0004220E17|nr:GNAT family N-acetyltransferase [Cucumibacter marinus]